MNVSYVSLRNAISTQYGDLIGDCKISPTVKVKAIAALGFPLQGEISGCLVMVSPFPTGRFSRLANDSLQSETAEMVVRVYQYADSEPKIHKLVPRICLLGPLGAHVSYVYDRTTQVVPFAEISLIWGWSLSEYQGECPWP
jgi:hypothetical protein